MNSYEAKVEARRERLEAAAAKANAESLAHYNRAKKMGEAIPFGQPILVGHHSEKRDRNYRARISGKYGKAFELSDKAAALAAKAAAVGTGGISQDDPEAVAKLKVALAEREALQAVMVAANKVVKKFHNAGLRDASAGELFTGYLEAMKKAAPSIGEQRAAALLKPDFCGRIGFAAFELQNNNANIRRIKERIEKVQVVQALPDEKKEIGDVTILQEDGRVQLVFPGKPSEEIRKELKGHGFKWSPTRGAWVRKIGGMAQYQAERIAKLAGGAA